MDLQVFPWDRIPAATVCRQLVHQLILAGQRQTEPCLSPMSETQLSPLADSPLDALTSLSSFGAQRQQPLSQKTVEQLVAGSAVLAQYQDVRSSTHSAAQELFLMAGEGDATELRWREDEEEVFEVQLCISSNTLLSQNTSPPPRQLWHPGLKARAFPDTVQLIFYLT